ncbi:MAG TPA: Re/Si-specific NAD(P)(+) transhydrogenase subunit alpha [Caulobacteraceae bacterium]|jgi:NAD(P) transhydrogenase subunit alpha
MAARLAVIAERAGETRAALSPESAKKLIAMGFEVAVQSGTGAGASIPDGEYSSAGAYVVPSAEAALADAHVVFGVRAPEPVEAIRPGSIVVALLNPHAERDRLQALGARGVTAFAMEFVPRITRAQSMDALSSQANLAGYRAVIEAAECYGKALPMMMTAAGTVAAAKVFVMGAGVAGLQAIATARRLGAVVTATDVRPAAKEQVESLGAKFVAVENDEFKQAETAAGYAKPMSEEYQQLQAALVAEHVRKQDIVITTALIPGRPAPKLLSAEHVASLRPGSVVVDMAVEQGGNVAGSRFGEMVVTDNGAAILGYANLAGRVPADATALYARNLLAFAGLLLKDGQLAPDYDDEILKGALVMRDGEIVHPALQSA